MQSSDFTLRYHSLHDNQYLRYFRGHSARITALAMSPKNDLFMSAAEVRGLPASGDFFSGSGLNDAAHGTGL